MEEHRYCPCCGAEYDPDIPECADCFVKLVIAGELPAARERLLRAQQPNEAVVYLTHDLGEAQEIVHVLSLEGLTARVDSIDTRAAGMTFRPGWVYHVVVPAREREEAQLALQYGFPETQVSHASAQHVQEKARRLEMAIQGGEDGLGALAEFFGETGELRVEALKAALDCGEAGRELAAEWVKKMCREHELEPGELQAVGDACFLLGTQHPEWAVAELAPELMNGDAWVRKNFCFALGKLGTEKAVPYLVAALRDPEAQIRNEAIDQLYNFEHTDYGFDPDLEPEQQPEALAKWQKFASRIR